MTHVLDIWKPYLSFDNFHHLIQFVENSKNNVHNNKLLILLGNGGPNGKSTLISHISKYIGEENFRLSDTNGSGFFDPTVKLIHIPAIDNYNRKHIQNLINIIHSGQSIIAETNSILNININLYDHIKIIHMLHRFS